MYFVIKAQRYIFFFCRPLKNNFSCILLPNAYTLKIMSLTFVNLIAYCVMHDVLRYVYISISP